MYVFFLYQRKNFEKKKPFWKQSVDRLYTNTQTIKNKCADIFKIGLNWKPK